MSAVNLVGIDQFAYGPIYLRTAIVKDDSVSHQPSIVYLDTVGITYSLKF